MVFVATVSSARIFVQSHNDRCRRDLKQPTLPNDDGIVDLLIVLGDWG